MGNDTSNTDDENYVGSTYTLAYNSTSNNYEVFRIDMPGYNINEFLALKNGSWTYFSTLLEQAQSLDS